MMGSNLPAGQPVVLSVIPGETKERHVSESDTGTCDASVDGECSTQGIIASLVQPSSHVQEQIRDPGVILEAVHSSSAEDSNSTDGTKTPKVNCEERNITGITNFTLQILNISQVSREHSNNFLLYCYSSLFYAYLVFLIISYCQDYGQQSLFLKNMEDMTKERGCIFLCISFCQFSPKFKVCFLSLNVLYILLELYLYTFFI